MAKILIVDDAAIMRRSLQYFVEKAGHEVVCMACNGGEAVKYYKEHKPDLVTLDVMMEGMDGIQVLAEIKKEYPDAKVIMVTALGWEKKKEEARKLGAAGYIGKPFNAADIRNEIERVLGKSNGV